ncbi:MAG: c-type cytochrome [Candidatus Polarisedimenticolia bacterium]
MSRLCIVAASVACSLALAGAGLGAVAAEADLGTEAQREAGRVMYEKYCTQCHGEKGDGQGVATPRLKPKPRDFTRGVYKIRSTASGSLPTTSDLVRVIRNGLPYTSMPAWPQLSESELTELAYYIKTFSSSFADPAAAPQPMELPEPPAFSQESAERGKKLYGEIGCLQCHGELGRGDGTSGPTLVDDWGDHIRAADLTRRWTFRGGPGRKDIFRAFTTALSGSPMPSYADSLTVEQRWDLTDYVWSLSPADEPGYGEVAVAARVDSAIELEGAAELFEKAKPAYIPIVGQIMEPGRNFFPAVEGISVRAVYNDSDVAIELRWNDMRAETSGANSPALPVPPAEDDNPWGAAGAAQAAGEGAAAGDDFWGGDEATPPKKEAPPAGEDDFWAEEGGAEGAAPGAGAPGEFSDAVAIQLPSVVPSGSVKPYFLFGDGGNPVDLWFMNLAGRRPEMFIGRGSGSLEPQGKGELSATAAYDRGEWTVVFKRPLREGGIVLEEGRFVPIAFSIWDGFNRERGNKRGISRWVSLYLEPGGRPSPYGRVAGAVAATLGIELLVIGLVRRRRARL